MKRFVVVVFLFAFACAPGRIDTPTADDLRFIINPASLQISKPIDASAIRCKVNPMGVRNVSCTYDWAKGAHAKNNDAILYYDSGYSRYSTKAEAQAAFRGVQEGYAKGVTTLHWVPADELLDFGDQHYAAYLMHKDGTRAGNAFILRRGNTVLRLLVSGAVIEDPKVVRALFEPLVKEIEK